MLYALILLAHHVCMALENDYRNILESWRSLLDDKHVTSLVSLAFEIVLCSKLLEVCNDVLFVARLSWDLGYFLEIGKYFF